VKTKPLYLEIFAISLAVILLEISYTRIFSFKLYYYFTYLIIGIGLLGLGAGAVFVAIFRGLRESDPSRLVPPVCFAGAASVLLGYFVIAPAPLNASQLASSPWEVAKLIVVCLVLTAPFLAAGMAIATILGSSPARANRLYGADLLGAGLGCSVCIPLLVLLDPPSCIMLSGFILSLAGIRGALRSRALLAGGVLTAAALLLPVSFPRMLPDPTTDSGKHLERVRDSGRLIYSHWNPVFRVDVAEEKEEPVRMLLHDGTLGSGIHAWRGGLSEHERLERDGRTLPFSLLEREPRVLIVGSAGGHEILASLYFGAGAITGVELNPVTVDLLTERYADYAGRLHENPRVQVVNAEGRSFLHQNDENYDLIWFVAPDSYAAMNAASSAAFVLSESYLYTVEAIRQSLGHLAPGGVICAQFGEFNFDGKPNRTVRYLNTARAAFAEEGITEFGRHVLVTSSQGLKSLSEITILLSRSPFTPGQIQSFRERSADIARGVVRHPSDGSSNSAVSQAIGLPVEQLEDWFDTYPYDLSPVRDDAPFFWHFARLRDAVSAPLRLQGAFVDYEDAIGEQVMLILLLISALVAAAFLLVPLAAIRSVWREMPCKANAGLYFAALGLGFMFFEVCLIQMLTLFLGYPTYSLSVTLFGLLIFSGIGSLLSGSAVGRRNRALMALVAGLAVVLIAYRALAPLVIEGFAGAPIAVRVGLTLVLIAPLGLCLGAFMPLGLRTVASLSVHEREYVAWAWAVNGFFSVMSSIAATLLAMTMGFRSVMLLALAIYAIGAAALSRIPQPPPRNSAPIDA
jgi:hypothetical protein